MIPGLPPPDAAYATHFPVLAAVVARTSGDVAEVGSGQFSTPLLEALIQPPRKWATYETDPSWISSLRLARLPNHRVVPLGAEQVPDLSGFEVVLIDGEIPGHRADVALGCQGRILLLHDANPDWEPTYHYRERVVPRFRYHAFYSRLRPWTLIVSNDVDPFSFLPRTLLFRE